MRWRSQWEVDTKLSKEYEPNDFMQKHYISGLSGYDKTGAPGKFKITVREPGQSLET